MLKKGAYLALILFVLLLFAAWFFVKEANRNQSVLTEADTKAQTQDTLEKQEIYVHITGAVNNPGVLKLPSGSRLVDAIEMAGGLSEAANSDQINLASILEDEDKIHIYEKTEGEASTAEGAFAASQQGKVNINTASLETLQTLPGVGEVIGKNIISYREKNGLFKSVENLKEVDRIGDKLYEKIKDAVTL